MKLMSSRLNFYSLYLEEIKKKKKVKEAPDMHQIWPESEMCRDEYRGREEWENQITPYSILLETTTSMSSPGSSS